ncbi:MAG: exonuclease domain-containing protein [Candidatus Omnitrophica bacterium]|nr:exonuclease domain-containing protein [Candidatus Omnitrophota bacterium]
MLNLEEIEFTIFDTETTGLQPESGDRIVEIAGIRIRGNQRLGKFQSLVNPKRLISEPAFRVNQINQEMLKDAPEIKEVMPKFLEFIKGSILCSYNASFDLGFLNYELSLMGKTLPLEILSIDILKMTQLLLPGLERYALDFVAERLGIHSQQLHRALSDVELTLEVFFKLKEILRQKNILDKDNLLSLFGLNCKSLQDIIDQRLAQIQEAIDLGVKLKIRYLSGLDATVTERQIIPRQIKKQNSHIYLIGYCCLRDQERTFRIDRILSLEII